MESFYCRTPDDINWYVERFSPAQNTLRSGVTSTIILIPSGEGDCHNLRNLGMLLAQSGHHAVSFDLPGFSRTTAPKEAYTPVTPQLVTRQIATLMDELHIDVATFFGNSSGGGVVLAMLALYPERATCGIVHEVPLEPFHLFNTLTELPDDEVVAQCEYFFANHFIEQAENDGRAKWDALGSEYHARLRKNYVTWVRNIVNKFESQSGQLATVENLRRKPIFWTVGGLSDREAWAKDFEIAESAGLEVRTDVLWCKHFPYVSMPEKLSGWIAECVAKARN